MFVNFMCNVFEAFVSFLGRYTAVVHMFLNWQFLQEFVSCLWQITEAVYMPHNLLCTAFKYFASVFWHYAASMYPVFEHCSTTFLQCGAVAFILYLIVHICHLIRHVDRLQQREERREEQQEERREEQQEERQNQTNAPAATVAPTCELTLAFAAEIEKMQLNTRLLIAASTEVEIQFRSAQQDMEEEALLFQQQEGWYEEIRSDFEQRVQYSYQNQRLEMEIDYNHNRPWLSPPECAARSMAIVQSRQEEHRYITQLNTSARVAKDERCYQQYLNTEDRNRHYEQLVLLAGERVLLAHRRRLQTHANDADSLAVHEMRVRNAR